MSASDKPFGLVGEFRTPEDAVAVARDLREAGFTRWDIYGPAPLEEIERAVPTRRGIVVSLVMFAAAIAGALWGYFIQYWDAVLAFPINVGGRPLNGWPGFVPSAWEICALFTVYFGFFAVLATSRLPRLHHPIFAAPRFDRATQDRFFVAVEARDERYDAARLRDLFARHGLVEAAEIAS
jgi:MFS family permease